jgi:arsenate reductase-like glutaredoxin family protein
MIRRNSKDHKTLGVGKMRLTEQSVVDLLHAHPDLAARPIVITRDGPFLSRDLEFFKNLKRS